MQEATRTISVLFTDLVGSTASSERWGPQESLRLTTEHLAALRDALCVHRGTEVKTLGDGIMAVFESVHDAVGCAVTMQRAVARHNRLQPEFPQRMRVGISLGEATPSADGDWSGRPVVEASRLCASARDGGIIVSDLVHALSGTSGLHLMTSVGDLDLKGLSGPTAAWAVDWDEEEEFGLRVALADDTVLLREGIASVLSASGLEVVLQASDADTVVRSIVATRPHVVLLDMRMPPTFTTEGLDAAHRIRAEHPEVGVLVLSATVDAQTARQLLGHDTSGIGYLLKDRVADIDTLTAAIRTVARGGSAIDEEVLALL